VVAEASAAGPTIDLRDVISRDGMICHHGSAAVMCMNAHRTVEMHLFVTWDKYRVNMAAETTLSALAKRDLRMIVLDLDGTLLNDFHVRRISTWLRVIVGVT
jgi:hypothetical protein